MELVVANRLRFDTIALTTTTRFYALLSKTHATQRACAVRELQFGLAVLRLVRLTPLIHPLSGKSKNRVTAWNQI